MDWEQIADGMALWDEHKPQSGEDWLAVAERFVADDCTTEHSSPLFAGLALAVQQRDELLAAIDAHRTQQNGATRGNVTAADRKLYRAAERVRKGKSDG